MSSNSGIDTSIFFHSIFTNTKILALLILDPEGIVITCNDVFSNSFGYKLEDIQGKNFSIFFTEEDKKIERPKLEIINTHTKGSAVDENFLVHKNGNLTYVRGESIFVKGKSYSFIVKTITDINEQKLLENFLIDSNKFSEAIIETISDPIIVLNADYKIEKANLAFYKRFCHNEKIPGLLQHPFFEINNGFWNQEAIKALLNSTGLTEEKVSGIEVLYNNSSSEDQYYRLSATAIVRDGQQQDLILIVFKDITIEKTNQALLENEIKKLTEAREETERINKDLDNFVYSASHDLMNPVNNIEALVKLLSQNLASESKDIKFLDLINKSIEIFKKKLRELSAIAKEKEKCTVVDFLEIEREVELELHKEIKESGAIIKTNFIKAPSICFLKKNVRSILYNLVSNSIKYRSPERTPVIELSTEDLSDGFTKLTVKDNGLGIKKENQEKIFEMYRRSHSHVAGTGVGLGLITRILENWGGKIEMESEEGVGTTFYVYLKPMEQAVPKNQ